MKKSLLNITVTMALSAAVFSGSVLSTQAYAGQPASEKQLTDNRVTTEHSSNKSSTNETYMQPGIGIGAATGTLIAGPVGLVVGGLIGAVVGSSVEVSSAADITVNDNTSMANSDTALDTAASENKTEIIDDSSLAINSSNSGGLQVAQTGPLNMVIENSIDSQQDVLMDIFTADFSLDIYFRSGGADIEPFYPVRLAAIADLMQTMDGLDVHLDGYTDRRGNKQQNTSLASQRIEKVRENLISNGVDESRIISKAFGEMKMVSTVGDLEAYNFDRKVVIRFERTAPDSIASMVKALDDFSTEKTGISNNEKNMNPEVAEINTRF